MSDSGCLDSRLTLVKIASPRRMDRFLASPDGIKTTTRGMFTIRPGDIAASKIKTENAKEALQE